MDDVYTTRVIRRQMTVELRQISSLSQTLPARRPAPAAVQPTSDASTGEAITRRLPGWPTNGWCLPLPENLVVAMISGTVLAKLA